MYRKYVLKCAHQIQPLISYVFKLIRYRSRILFKGLFEVLCCSSLEHLFAGYKLRVIFLTFHFEYQIKADQKNPIDQHSQNTKPLLRAVLNHGNFWVVLQNQLEHIHLFPPVLRGYKIISLLELAQSASEDFRIYFFIYY